MTEAKKAYDALVSHLKETALLGSCAGVLGWDERTYLPRGGAQHRAEQLALLAGMVHDRVTAPEVGEWLAQLEGSALSSDPSGMEAVNVREARRDYDLATKLPKSLVEEMARVTTLAQQVWSEARKTSDFQLFLPHLDKVVGLKMQEAAALGTGATAYDALLDAYEPGETTAHLTQVFADLRDALVPLVGAIADSGIKPETKCLSADFPVKRQAEFGKTVASRIGFDFECGRLDETAHPFCSGLGPGDTRLTTRYDRNFFPQAFFGILHEAGHGIYDQGLDRNHYGTPMGDAVSLGIHESQSRMWENFVGRSRSFWVHFFPQARTAFPEALDRVSLDGFYRAINRVEPSFIRVESDEATYNLHIVVRFEMEQALINEGLKARDVPGAWNEAFRKYFGMAPPDDAQGCLQDIHWSGGGIGYFPTYALGNLYAAQFFERARIDLGDLDAQFASGDFSPLKSWLAQKIFRHGKRYRAGELVEAITGKPLSHESLMRHLKARFEPLYGIR